MSDILHDYHEWKSGLPVRIGTHSDRCHMYHEKCMIHRLAAEVERLRSRLRLTDAVIRSGDAAALTDAEQAAIEAGAIAVDRLDEEMDGFSSNASRTLRALLERLK